MSETKDAKQADSRTYFERIPTVAHRMGVSVSTTWGRIKSGHFPPPVRIGPNAVAVPSHETDAMQRALIAGADDDAVKLLVQTLVAARRNDS